MKRLLAAIFLVGTMARAAHSGSVELPDLRLREVLATGDVVPDLGPIGVDGFRLIGIADDGRLLIAGSLSDGRFGLFWADTDRVDPIWLTGDLDQESLAVFRAQMSSAGWLVAPARTSRFQGLATGFFVFRSRDFVRSIQVPETDGAGNRICAADPPLINANGDLAFAAEIARPDEECFASDITPGRSVYVLRGTELERRIGVRDGSGSSSADWLRLLRIADDASLIVAEEDRSARSISILRVSDGRQETIVAVGNQGPSAETFTFIQPVDTSERGEVLFSGWVGEESAIYRTERGRLVRVMSNTDRPPEGIEYQRIGDDAMQRLSNDGTVVLSIGLKTDSNLSWVQDTKAVVLFPIVGAPRVLYKSSSDPYRANYRIFSGSLALNNVGQVAFTQRGIDASSEGLRLTDGRIESIVRTGDSVMGDSLLVENGLEGNYCVSPDGRLSLGVSAADGSEALICMDGEGFHLIARNGDRAPNGYRFGSLRQARCFFTNDDELLFSATTGVPTSSRVPGGELHSFVAKTSLFRASDDGISQIVMDPIVFDDGTELEPFASGPYFAANASGEIVFGALGREGSALLRQRGQQVEKIIPPVLTRERHALRTYGEPQPTDAGEIIMTANLSALPDPFFGDNAIVIWHEGELRVLIDGNDAVFGDVRFKGFSGLKVRGNQAVFVAAYEGFPRTDDADLFLYTAGEAAPRRIFTFSRSTAPGGLSLLGIVGLASPGSVLLHGLIPKELNGYFLIRPDEDPLPLLRWEDNPRPIAIDETGTIALIDYKLGRERLLLSGPGPGEIRCPVPPRIEEVDCPADCNADGVVSVAEIITGVGIALGERQAAECPVFDGNEDEEVSVDELLRAVGIALDGCAAS